MSDQLVAETSTWQHTTLTTEKYPCPRWDSNPWSQQVSGRRPFTCWDLGFESQRGHRYLSVVSVVCCQVEVSVTSWSLVQRSPGFKELNCICICIFVDNLESVLQWCDVCVKCIDKFYRSVKMRLIKSRAINKWTCIFTHSLYLFKTEVINVIFKCSHSVVFYYLNK